MIENNWSESSATVQILGSKTPILRIMSTRATRMTKVQMARQSTSFLNENRTEAKAASIAVDASLAQAARRKRPRVAPLNAPPVLGGAPAAPLSSPLAPVHPLYPW